MPSTVEALKKLGVENPFREELKTPPQVEKELSKEQKKELAKFTKTVVIGHAVVPSSARGEPVDLSSVSEFSEIVEDGEAN